MVARVQVGEADLEDEVGEVREDRQRLVYVALERGDVTGQAQRGGEARGERGSEPERAHVALGGDARPGLAEVLERELRLAQGAVLGPEVEVQERRLAVLLELALEQLEVAPALVLLLAHDPEVAEVLHADVGGLDALGQVARQAVGDLLVDAALEAVLGPVAEDAQGVVVDGRAVLEVAGVVGLDEEERLAPDAAGELAQARGLPLAHDLVGVEVDDPVARRGLEGDVARRGEIAGPLGLHDRGAERPGDLDRAVGRAGVDDDDLVEVAGDGLQAAREHRLLVAHDHAERDRQALGGAGAAGHALGVGLEAAQRRDDRARQARDDAVAAPAGDLVEVALDVGEVRIEPARGLEERLGAGERAQLVEGDAGQVEQERLARLLVEDRQPLGGHGDEDRGDLLDGAARGGEAGLQELLADGVAAVDVGLAGRVAEERAVAGEVAGGQQLAGALGELGGAGAGARGGVLGLGEAQRHGVRRHRQGAARL